ncbi:MAG: ribosomal protein S18-alanine N-acetyltransferase [Chloroflexi bacterium]|nr:ribosomal protein S18-alanine N-acetyltransferase [Chloroflexota bacterium]
MTRAFVLDNQLRSVRLSYVTAAHTLMRALPSQQEITEQTAMTGLTLRYMNLADIPSTVEIDRMAFDPPWSARSYAYEIEESHYSHMLVLEADVVRPVHGLRRWLRALAGQKDQTEKMIVGYGGLWTIMDEAHISTIATHPDWRGRGWGELLLAAMIQRAITLNAGYVVLEVRVSNTVAQNLYRKYGFEIVDLRPSYYRNNNEDAYDMRLSLTDRAAREQFAARWQTLLAEHELTDMYSAHKRPS